MKLIDIKVPDIGDFTNIPVIELLVKAGDRIEAETPLVTLESDKATLDVPSPSAGTVKEVLVKLGDKVSEGSLLLQLEASESLPLQGGGQEGDGVKPGPSHYPLSPP